jgi:hypothetical protein
MKKEKYLSQYSNYHIIIFTQGLTVNNGSLNTKDIHVKIVFNMADVYEVN